jgi:hypothetical protein
MTSRLRKGLINVIIAADNTHARRQQSWQGMLAYGRWQARRGTLSADKPSISVLLLTQVVIARPVYAMTGANGTLQNLMWSCLVREIHSDKTMTPDMIFASVW